MDLISSRYRKPKGRPTKKRKMLAENSKKRWQKSPETVDEKNSNRRVPESYCEEARHIITQQSERVEGEKVTLGGRKQGSLTDKNITKLQNYYRKAIKDNVPDTNKMKTATYASLTHCSSTDKKPMHGKCPEGESSWCFYKRAIAKGETPGSHSSMRTYLSPLVVEKIMPVYQRLASDTILGRFVAGKTQNSNESLHSCIWRKCP
ncbi:uncharacterized protein TNCV_2535081 [Trichonephila clavipes]|nr:uncharacterized protein TNCV_2535081 [Trichonephila clavipes]